MSASNSICERMITTAINKNNPWDEIKNTSSTRYSFLEIRDDAHAEHEKKTLHTGESHPKRKKCFGSFACEDDVLFDHVDRHKLQKGNIFLWSLVNIRRKSLRRSHQHPSFQDIKVMIDSIISKMKFKNPPSRFITWSRTLQSWEMLDYSNIEYRIYLMTFTDYAKCYDYTGSDVSSLANENFNSNISEKDAIESHDILVLENEEEPVSRQVFEEISDLRNSNFNDRNVDNFEVIDAAKERNVGSSVPVEEFTTNVEQKDEATSLILTDSINIKEARLRFSAGSKKSFMIRKKTISGSPKKNELESILFKFREKDESDTTTPESDTVVFQKVWPDGSVTDFNSLADVIKGEKLTQDNRPPQMSLGCAVNVATARALFTKGRRISIVRKNTKESHADNTDSLSHIDEIPADDQVAEFTLVGDDTSFDSNTNEGGVTTAVKKDDGYAYFTVHTGADQPTEIKRITE